MYKISLRGNEGTCNYEIPGTWYFKKFKRKNECDAFESKFVLFYGRDLFHVKYQQKAVRIDLDLAL